MEPIPADNITEILNVTIESTEQAKEVLDILIKASPSWAVFCGNIAPIVTAVLRLSPIPTVYQFVTRGSVGSLPLMPYTALLSDSVLWLFFGLIIADSRIVLSHSFGLFFALTYSIFYARTYRVSGNKDDLTILPGTLSQHGCFIFLIIFLSCAIIALMPLSTAKLIIGYGADCGSIFMYTGPMAAVRAVLREKNAASLPLPFTVMCFLNGFCWFAYGWFVLREIILWGPSIIGVILSTTQLVLICYFGSRIDDSQVDDIEMKPRTIKPSKSDHGIDSEDDEKTDPSNEIERLIPDVEKN